MSVAATTIIASAFASQASAATYQVKKGDSLWSIAHKYDTTINQLKELNKLKSDAIFPNQVLTVSKEAAKASASSIKTPTVSTKPVTNVKAPAVTAPKPASTAKTYTVKSGDTLSGIASKNKVKLADLLTWNKLKATTIIYPGQVILVSKGTVTTSTTKPAAPNKVGETTKTPSSTNKTDETSKSPAPPAKTDDSSQASYTVKAGDTLSALGLQFSITVEDLKKLNGLTSDNIFVGQKLNVGSAVAAPQTPPTSNITTGTPVGTTNGLSVTTLINNATKLLGTPYAWAGSSLSGFDCSGFIYYVYNQVGINLPRTSSTGYYSRSFYVNNPQPGDLVFFADTYQKGISHLGIYLGNNQFIHAGDNGVEISSLNETYWKNHFDGFKRLYETI